MEQRKEVKVFMVRLYCDECGEEMHNDGSAYMSNPSQYAHFCKNGHETWDHGH